MTRHRVDLIIASTAGTPDVNATLVPLFNTSDNHPGTFIQILGVLSSLHHAHILWGPFANKSFV
jgi:hypothetical protein